MHQPAVTLSPVACERVQGGIATASSLVTGFALLAGARAFTFIALFAWREPVLGGVGLMLLALVGWCKWCCARSTPLTSTIDLTKVLPAVTQSFKQQDAIGGYKAMQTSNPITSTTNNTYSTSSSSVSGSRKSNQPTFQELLSQLTDYTKGTPGERLEKSILAQLGYTEEDLKNMSPEERDKVMKKVQELLKKELDAAKQVEEAKKGVKIDVSV
jgi:hypothetical protein